MRKSGFQDIRIEPLGTTHKAVTGKKLPIYFTRADGEPITFAAIQDAWNNPQNRRAHTLMLNGHR